MLATQYVPGTEEPGGLQSMGSRRVGHDLVTKRQQQVLLKSFLLLFNSVAQSCLTLCNPMDCSTPGFPVPHQLPQLVQTHVHQVGDAIQPSHPLSSPSPPTFNLFQHQSLFQWVSLPIRWPKHWSFSFSISISNEYSGMISFRIDWFYLLAVQGTLKSLLQTIVQKHQFFGIQFSLWSNSHIHTWILEKP